MPLLQPDYSQAVIFGEPKPGVYDCQIVSYEGKMSQSNEKYLQWKLKVIGLEKLPDVYYTTMMEGRAAGMPKHFLKCVLNDYSDGAFDPDQLIGKLVQMELGVKEIDKRTGGTMKVFDVKRVSKPESEEDIPF